MRTMHLVGAGLVAVGLVGGGATGAAPAPAKPATPPKTTTPAKPAAPAKPSTSSTPSAQRPVINLTATTFEPRRAQLRLAQFINAIQAGNYKGATAYLSRRVSAAERQQLVTGPWLRKTRRNDFNVLLYMPQIEIRTISFRTTQARLRILPRTFEKTRGQAFGIWDIPMVLENNRWMLNIHPDKAVAAR